MNLDELSRDPATSLPRSNGELVFEEPWEGRAFGMAAALADAGIFDWKDFQIGLIAAIDEREAGSAAGAADTDQVYRYYERWLAALETLVVTKGLLKAGEIDALAEAFSQRPAGHDHAHADHQHPHTH